MPSQLPDGAFRRPVGQLVWKLAGADLWRTVGSRVVQTSGDPLSSREGSLRLYSASSLLSSSTFFARVEAVSIMIEDDIEGGCQIKWS